MFSVEIDVCFVPKPDIGAQGLARRAPWVSWTCHLRRQPVKPNLARTVSWGLSVVTLAFLKLLHDLLDRKAGRLLTRWKLFKALDPIRDERLGEDEQEGGVLASRTALTRG
jgi:hypothetical protein